MGDALRLSKRAATPRRDVVVIWVGQVNPDIQFVTAWPCWIAGGQLEVIEDFENISPDWYSTLNTNIGTFTAGGAPGEGNTSFSQSTGGNDSEVKFQLIDTDSSYWGRFNTTSGGSKFLDSADITEITLDFKSDLDISKLFFFLTDPGDVQAKTTISSDTVSKNIDPVQNSDGSLWFVGIDAGADYISQIIWSVNKTNDGFGLDDFTKVSAVPEPGTLLLLGSGLAGLALYRRKMNKV